jgi:hypothetical protein
LLEIFSLTYYLWGVTIAPRSFPAYIFIDLPERNCFRSSGAPLVRGHLWG